MENFKFKVGDKIRIKNFEPNQFVEVISLIGSSKNNDLFTAMNKDGIIEGDYLKKAKWLPYEEPKKKIKLQKFYVKIKDIWSVSYSDKRTIYGNEDCLNGTVQSILTEEEFLEQFEIRSND